MADDQRGLRVQQLVAAIEDGQPWGSVLLPLDHGDTCGATTDEALEALDIVVRRYQRRAALTISHGMERCAECDGSGGFDPPRAECPVCCGRGVTERDPFAAPFDGDELVRWAELYGHPEEWAKKAQAAHMRAERAEIERDALRALCAETAPEVRAMTGNYHTDLARRLEEATRG